MQRMVGFRLLGILLLSLMFGGAQAAQGMERGAVGHALALQDDPICTELVTDTGTPGVDVAFDIGTPADDAAATDDTEEIDLGRPDDTDVEIPGSPDPDDAVEAADADVDGATPAAAGTPVEDVESLLGEDRVLDPNDEAFLCQDVDGDGNYEIGIDVDQDGTLDENEVLGTDVNEDESLTENEFEFEPEVAEPGDDGAGGVGTPDFANYAGDDNIFDSTDEGFVREDLNNDETFEIGYDEDQSGTLEENEVLGIDVNNDEALTEDELGS